MLKFKSYIKEMALQPLTAKEILKYDWRTELFLKKYKAGEKFEMKDGKKRSFEFDQDNYNAIEKRNQSAMNKIRLIGDDGVEYALGALGKSAEFGGKGAGAGTAKEDRELISLRQQIYDAKAEEKTAEIKVKIGNKTCNVADVVSTPGTPKSDFHLIDMNGNEVVWISHKDGRGPKDFQQWGGISNAKEPAVFSHPEVQKFINDLKKQYPNGLPTATSLYRKIQDTKLKYLSVYGNQYGRTMGRQNVSILIQGPVKLVKTGKIYQFNSNHIHFNGDSVDSGGFEPVLAAIYKGDRSDAGVKGTRIVIMPIEGRKFKGEV